MVGALLYLILPVLVPQASIDLTILMDSWSATSPKTTCLPSNHAVSTVVMKNWEPLLKDKVSKYISGSGGSKDVRVRSSIGHRKETWLGVLDPEVLIRELFAPD